MKKDFYKFIIFLLIGISVFFVMPLESLMFSLLFLGISLYFLMKCIFHFGKKIGNLDEKFWKIQLFLSGVILLFSIIGHFLQEYRTIFQIMFYISLGITFFVVPTIAVFYKKFLYNFMAFLFSLGVAWVSLCIFIIGEDFGSSGGGLLVGIIGIYPVFIVPIIFIIKIIYKKIFGKTDSY